MKKALYLAAALCAVAAPAAYAQVVVDMSLITCRQFRESPPDRQEMITSWMGGYFSASKNLSAVDFRYVQRNHKAIVAYCKNNGREGLLSAVQKISR